MRSDIFPIWVIVLSILNILAITWFLFFIYYITWKRTAIIFAKHAPRIYYLLRINPISALFWWLIWIIPLSMGFHMFLTHVGLVWQRTEKRNAIKRLFRHL